LTRHVARNVASLLVATSVVTSCSLFSWFESNPRAKVLWHVTDVGVSTPAFDSVSGTTYFLAADHRVVAIDRNGTKRWEGRTFDGPGRSLGLGGPGMPFSTPFSTPLARP
jgi:hypothetical protein